MKNKKPVYTKEQRKVLIEYLENSGYTHDSAVNIFTPKLNEQRMNQKEPECECVIVEKKETKKGIVEVSRIMKMPKKHRDTLILYLYGKGFSLEWISQSLGVTYQTVAQVIFRNKHKNE